MLPKENPSPLPRPTIITSPQPQLLRPPGRHTEPRHRAPRPGQQQTCGLRGPHRAALAPLSRTQHPLASLPSPLPSIAASYLKATRGPVFTFHVPFGTGSGNDPAGPPNRLCLPVRFSSQLNTHEIVRRRSNNPEKRI